MLRIVSQATSVESFIQLFSRLCDHESVFIVTGELPAPGTRTRFVLALATGEIALRGEGTIAEVYPHRAHRYGHPGMRLRFTELDDASRALLDRMTAASAAAGTPVASPPGPPPRPGMPPAPERSNDALVQCAVFHDSDEVAVPAQAADAAAQAADAAAQAADAAAAQPSPAPARPATPGPAAPAAPARPAMPVPEAPAAPARPATPVPRAGTPSPLPPDRTPVPPAQPTPPGSLHTPPGSMPGMTTPPPGSMHTPPPGSMTTQPPGSMHTPPPGSMTTPPPGSMHSMHTPPPGSMHSMHTPPGSMPGMPAYPAVGPGSTPIPMQYAVMPPRSDELTEIVQPLKRPINRKAVLVSTVMVSVAGIVAVILLSGPGAPSGAEDENGAHPTAEGSHDPAGDTADEAEPVASCAVHIVSEPEGATVMSGDSELGTTPLHTTLPCGEITLELERARHGAATVSATLQPDEDNHITARLERPRVPLEIVSEPGGATVSINGKKAGTTPLTIELEAYSRVQVTVRKSGYRTYRERVVPDPPRATIKAELRKRR